MTFGANPTAPAGQSQMPLRFAHAPPVVVDASVWISWLAPNDANHHIARLWLDRHTANGGEMVAPALLLTEVAAGIRRATNSANDAQAMASYLATFVPLTLVPLEPALVSGATYVAAQFALKAADAFYVAAAKEIGIPLVTFDKEQLARPVGYIVTLRP